MKKSLFYFIGKLYNKIFLYFLAARWFPLLDTFYLRRNWLYDVSRFANTRKIHLVFDVGANVGKVSNEISLFFPKANIFAFEPTTTTFNILKKNTERKSKKIKAFQLALGSRSGIAQLFTFEYSEANTLIAANEAQKNNRNLESVKIERLDKFCVKNKVEKIDILKTDTEGFDLEVLKGAGKLIKKNPIPFIFTEVGFMSSDKTHTKIFDVLKMLEPHGYVLKGIYDQWAENKENELFCNALFIHPEEIQLRYYRKQSMK